MLSRPPFEPPWAFHKHRQGPGPPVPPLPLAPSPSLLPLPAPPSLPLVRQPVLQLQLLLHPPQSVLLLLLLLLLLPGWVGVGCPTARLPSTMTRPVARGSRFRHSVTHGRQCWWQHQHRPLAGGREYHQGVETGMAPPEDQLHH